MMEISSRESVAMMRRSPVADREVVALRSALSVERHALEIFGSGSARRAVLDSGVSGGGKSTVGESQRANVARERGWSSR